MSTTDNTAIIAAIAVALDAELLSLDDLVDGELDWLVEASKALGVRVAVESFLEDGAEELAELTGQRAEDIEVARGADPR